MDGKCILPLRRVLGGGPSAQNPGKGELSLLRWPIAFLTNSDRFESTMVGLETLFCKSGKFMLDSVAIRYSFPKLLMMYSATLHSINSWHACISCLNPLYNVSITFSL